jgi:hypothetical protein
MECEVALSAAEDFGQRESEMYSTEIYCVEREQDFEVK